MDRLVTIDILGQPFAFKSDTDELEARAVADFVVKAVEKVRSQQQKKNQFIDKSAVLILTALNITSDLFDLQKKHQQLLKEIDERSAQMLSAIDAKLS